MYTSSVSEHVRHDKTVLTDQLHGLTHDHIIADTLYPEKRLCVRYTILDESTINGIHARFIVYSTDKIIFVDKDLAEAVKIYNNI